jgi:hypothetical protein
VTALTSLTLLVAACSGDSVTETTGDMLSEQEVQELFTALSAINGAVLPLAAPQAAGPQLTPIPVDESFNESAPCPSGGSLSVSGNIKGTVDDETFAADLEFDLTQDMSNCGVTTASLVQFTLNGEPDINIAGDMSMSETDFSGSLSYTGGFAWVTDDERSGTCGVNFDVSFSSASQSGTYSGQICGQAVTDPS